MYDYKKIEEKWQKYWEENHTFIAHNKSDKQKYYILVEFPYPSGAGLHVGHVRSYTALDTLARKRRMEGYNVLFPMGISKHLKDKFKVLVFLMIGVVSFQQQIQNIINGHSGNF